MGSSPAKQKTPDLGGTGSELLDQEHHRLLHHVRQHRVVCLPDPLDKIAATPLWSTVERGVFLSPAEGRGDVLEDAFQHVRVVLHAELVGHGQQQRIGFGYRFVSL